MANNSSGSDRPDISELTAETVKAEDLERFPFMTGWFDPRLLSKLLLRVIVSDLFGQYADRRLIEAALDTEMANKNYEPSLSAAPDGSIWIDYAADLGDGFDATYAIAYLLAQPELKIGDAELRRGSALIFGGDEVYPTADRTSYNVKLRKPYEFAWPTVDREDKCPPVFAVPGNHDWYDGLAVFLAYFCRTKTTRLGNWGSIQRRSYFSVKLTDKWWLWGIDIALVRDMDQPQADYFVAAAKAIPEKSNIILCSAEPGWYQAESGGDSFQTLEYASSLARNAKREFKIPLVLSGDSHHYARYTGPGTQFITSGGGGAFLHGTLELKPTIPIEWDGNENSSLDFQKAYPTQEESRKLLLGNFRFFAKNTAFAYTLGTIYWLFAFVLTSAWNVDVGALEYVTLLCGFFGYSLYQEKKFSRATLLAEAVHSALHFFAIWLLSAAALWAYSRWLPQVQTHWFPWMVALAIPIIPIGARIAAWIFGLNLYLTCRYMDRNHNDAFSAMKLDSHRHFVRMHIEGDKITIYPVAIDSVPERNEWQMNPNRSQTAPSVFEPANPLDPHFIEEPIVIAGAAAVSTEQVEPDPDVEK